jgi:hypothetical protein
MGRFHSIFQASDKINHNAKNKLENNITYRITFSPIIPRKRNPPFAFNKRPTKKKRVRSYSNSNNIKNKHNNQVAASNGFKTSARTTRKLYTNKRGIVKPPRNGLFSECLLFRIQPIRLEVWPKQ